MDSQSADTQTSILPKACENCRIRKIRCNRQNPCNNCDTSGIQCKPATKSAEQRSRVLLSANYEKQIEQINDRLVGIEDAIKNLRLSKSSASPAALPGRAPSISDPSQSRIETPTAFEGASSFTSQAIQASQAAGKSLERIQSSADLADALTSLRQLAKAPAGVGIKQPMRLGDASVLRQPTDIQLLPAQFVLSLLQEFKNRTSSLFLAYAIRDHRQLDRLCQQIYFPTDPVSLASLTLMNGMIYYLITQLLFEGGCGLCSDYDLRSLCDQAEQNFHRGVETYEIFASPSLDSAKVLMLAMLKAQEEFKPLLTWTFASTGARQVLSLGYHRRDTLKHDTFEVAEDKRQVFWSFYMVDKNLALNLGYSPTIQDYDIDVEIYQISSDPGVRPWDKAAIASIEIARLQGLIYERLYSLQALHASSEERNQVISDLCPQLEHWHQNWQQIDTGSAYQSSFFFLIYGAYDVVYYSLLTTMHRAATPSSNSIEITSACYEAAKKSLQAHFHFFPAFKSYGDAEVLRSYFSWILLYASWTPLIVVFLHAIAASSHDDVKLLEEVHESLDSLKNLNPGSEQVYNLSKSFSKLAKAFVERHSTFVGTYIPQEDMILMPQQNPRGQFPSMGAAPSAMQFANNAPTSDGAEFQAPSFDGTEMDAMSVFLGNFLGGNQPVGNLWTMDFTDNIEQ